MIRRRPRPAASLAASAMMISLLVCFAQKMVMVRADRGSFTHAINYGTEECLLIRVPKDQPHIISGSFDITESRYSTDPVRVALYNSDEKRIWRSDYGDQEGSFSEKGTGKHWLCLENGLTYEQQPDKERTDSRWKVTRTVGFAFRVKKSMSALHEEVLASAAEGGKEKVDETTRRLLELADDLNENFQVLEDHMSFMKAREIVHRELHEETFTSVVRWNLLEIAAVVIVSFGQVLNVWWILSKRSASYY